MQRILTLCVVAALVAACGDDGGSSTSASTTTAVGPAVVEVEERLEQRFEIGSPDFLTATEDAVWTKTDDGLLVRMDPSTNEVVDEVEVDETDELCQGIGTEYGERTWVWTCDDRDVVRVDATSGEVTTRVAVDKIAEQTNIVSAFNSTWVLTGDGSTLAGIQDGQVSTEIDLGVRCSDMAEAPEIGLWLSCLTEDAAVLVDLDQEAVTQRVDDLPGARAIASNESSAYVGTEEGIVQLELATGERLATAEVPLGQGEGLYADDTSVWARTEPFLVRLDAATMEVLEEISAPEVSGGSVLVAFDSVWASAFNDAVVYRLSPS